MEVYIVAVIIRKEKYYLSNFDGTLSKDVQNALIFILKSAAYFNATLIEKKYEKENALGKVEVTSFRELT